MTGKDLIIYILQNNLEDEQIFKDGRFLGFMSVDEAATKWNTGPATIKAWAQLKFIPSIKMGEQIYIPSIQFDMSNIKSGVDQK